VIDCEELGTSFIGTGLAQYERGASMALRCRQLTEVPKLLDSPEVRAYLARYVPLATTGSR
jgi:hypothetical protein